MANVFDELYKMNHSPDAIAARRARAQSRRTKVLDRIAEALGKQADAWNIEDLDLEHRPLGEVHPGSAASIYVREALSQFEIPSEVRVRYSGMKRQSGSGAHRMKDGVVTIEAEFESLSGVKHYIDVPVMVHEGRMVYPEILMHDGRVRVMAQSTFDDIIKNAETVNRPPDRKHMFSAPPTPGEQPRGEAVPQIGQGLYGIRAALRGYSKTAGEDGQAYVDENPNKNVVHDGNPADDYIDEAERDHSEALCPGAEVKLNKEIELRGRGGTVMTMSSGSKGTVIRDVMGNDRVYLVEFEGGCRAPVNRRDIG